MARRANATTTAYAASLVIRAVGARLFGITGYNARGSKRRHRLAIRTTNII